MYRRILKLLFVVGMFSVCCSSNPCCIENAEKGKEVSKKSPCEELRRKNEAIKTDSELTVIAKIEGYAVASSEYALSDGSIVVYDSIKMRVEEPSRYRDHVLHFHQKGILPDSSDWKQIGRYVCLLVKTRSMKEERELYLDSENSRNIGLCPMSERIGADFQ